MMTLFLNNYVIIGIIIHNYDVKVSVTGTIFHISVLIFNMTHLSMTSWLSNEVMTSIQDHYVIDDVVIYHYDVKVTVTHILSLLSV